MVVKVQRKSINSSGVWEVDETTLAEDTKITKVTPKSGKVKSVTSPKPKKDNSIAAPKPGKDDSVTTPKQGKNKSIITPKSGKGKPVASKTGIGKKGISPKSEKQNAGSPQKSEKQNTGSPQKAEKQNMGSPKKAEIQLPGRTHEKTNQSYSPLKRKGEGVDESTPAKQTKESEHRSHVDPVESTQTNGPITKTFCSWAAGELLNLVVRVEENCQHLLEEPYFSAVTKVDWSKISFDGRSPQDCERMWNLLFRKARTNREIVEEIREYLVGKEIVTVQEQKDSEEKSNETKLQEGVKGEEDKDSNDDSEEKESGAEEEEDGDNVSEEEDKDDTNEEDEGDEEDGDDANEEEEEDDTNEEDEEEGDDGEEEEEEEEEEESDE